MFSLPETQLVYYWWCVDSDMVLLFRLCCVLLCGDLCVSDGVFREQERYEMMRGEEREEGEFLLYDLVIGIASGAEQDCCFDETHVQIYDCFKVVKKVWKV